MNALAADRIPGHKGAVLEAFKSPNGKDFSIVKRKLRMFSLLIGLMTALSAGTMASAPAFAATSAGAAHTASAPSSAAHPGSAITLSASRSAGTVTVDVESAGATKVLTAPAAIRPHGFQCYFPTCGWQFSKAQTKGLAAAGTAAALAACHKYLTPIGAEGLCAAIVAWVLSHVGPKSDQCLYISTLPPGVIKYVGC
jgi:hypothetical protein